VERLIASIPRDCLDLLQTAQRGLDAPVTERSSADSSMSSLDKRSRDPGIKLDFKKEYSKNPVIQIARILRGLLGKDARTETVNGLAPKRKSIPGFFHAYQAPFRFGFRTVGFQ